MWGDLGSSPTAPLVPVPERSLGDTERLCPYVRSIGEDEQNYRGKVVTVTSAVTGSYPVRNLPRSGPL